MRQRLPSPPPDTKCVCGHRYYEHVPGGDRHACQHGAKPPFDKICSCGRFRPKSEVQTPGKERSLAALPSGPGSGDAPQAESAD